MNLGLRELAEFLAKHKNDESLVLATVTVVEGSSYRKPGAMMLIAQNRDFAGLISGGCLEGDLLEHASTVFKDGQVRRVTYDLSTDDEAIWGLGLGCGGTINLLLQKVEKSKGFAFLPGLFASIHQRCSCILALVDQDTGGFSAGTWAMLNKQRQSSGDAALIAHLKTRLHIWNAPHRYQYAEAGKQILLVKIDPAPQILICGAGPDAVPLARQVDALGWECIVVDHRKAFARSEQFPRSCKVIQLQPDQLLSQLREQPGLNQINAAIVMSHNLLHDNSYLKQLLEIDLPYLGLLGPEARRLQMQSDLGIEDGVIRGPVGFDIGAEMPESIALSIMAEVHAVLSGRPGHAQD